MMENNSKTYWGTVLSLLTKILIIWFVVSFGAGILFRACPQQHLVGWLSARVLVRPPGSIYIFIALIFYYAKKMGDIDRQFDVHEE
jgi:probable solute:sodium symporter small subunit